MSLISPEDNFAVGAALMLIIVFGMWADKTRIGRKITGALIVILAALGLSNLNVLPHESPAYGFVVSILVPIAIPMLLFKANLRRIFRETKSMLGLFLIATVCTILGTILAYYLVDLGETGSTLAGMFAAGYIGGSLNFVAVSEALGFDDPSRYAAALAADMLVSVPFLIVLVMLPSLPLVRRILRSRFEHLATDAQIAEITTHGDSEFKLFDGIFALGISFALAAIAFGTARMIGSDGLGIIFVTALALLFANVFHERCASLSGEFELGMVFMYLFFAVIGAGADIMQLINSAGPIFLFTFTILSTHLILLLVAMYVLKLDYAVALIASNACVLGPARGGGYGCKSWMACTGYARHPMWDFRLCDRYFCRCRTSQTAFISSSLRIDRQNRYFAYVPLELIHAEEIALDSGTDQEPDLIVVMRRVLVVI